MLRRHTPLRSYGTLSRRTRLRPVSLRHGIALREYYRKRKLFLSRPENRVCSVARALWGLNLPTTDIHHRLGRIGPLLTNERHWLAVSRESHRWIHDHPAQARARGWLGGA